MPLDSYGFKSQPESPPDFEAEKLVHEKLGFETRARKVIVGKHRVSPIFPLMKAFKSWERGSSASEEPRFRRMIYHIHEQKEHHLLSRYSTPKKSIKVFDSSVNLEHVYLADRTYAYNHRDESKTMMLDFDGENGLEQCKSIISLIGDPIFVEVSPTGHCHAIWLTKEKMTDNSLTHIIHFIRGNPFTKKVDVRKTTGFMRYPNSHNYISGVITNSEFIPFPTHKQFQDHVLSYNKRVSVQPLMPDLFSEADHQDIATSVFSKKRYSKKIVSTIREYTSSRHSSVQREQVINYGAGERYHGWLRIAGLCINAGKEFPEFLEKIISANTGSLDMQKWNQEKMEKEAKSFFDWCLLNFDKETPSFTGTFVPNDHWLDVNIRILCNKLVNYLMPMHPSNGGKWEKETRRSLTLLSKEIFGYIYLDSNSLKRRNPKSRMTEAKFLDISRGFQITREHLNALKERNQLKNDIHGLFNFFIQKSGMFKQVKSNDLGYCFNPEFAFSRQWELIGVETPNPDTILNTIRKIIKTKVINITGIIMLKDREGREPALLPRVIRENLFGYVFPPPI